jgi:glucan phosphoethanolaminetransferase (alkaline phosphatase superfamily)
MAGESGVKSVLSWTIGIASVAFVLLLMVIIFGNLSGNVGFATNTQGYNDTQNIILNYTSSATNTAEQFPTVGTILGVALLILILLALLVFVITKMSNVSGKGGDKGSFG